MVEVQQIFIEQMNERSKIIAAVISTKKEINNLITEAVNLGYTLKLLEEHLKIQIIWASS